VAVLYRRHDGFGRAVAFNRGLRGPAIDDVVNEAWTAIVGLLAQGRGPEMNFQGYLARAIGNAAVEAWRKSGQEILTDHHELLDTLHAYPVAPVDDDAIRVAHARAALGRLPDYQQQILARVFSGRPDYAALAAADDVSVNAVAQRAARAKRALRRIAGQPRA
jgi:DNA-directed RNA polymerase specialized sigma24 family protein